eukprot:UN21575
MWCRKCKHTYHFGCALKTGCFMESDFRIFCPDHFFDKWVEAESVNVEQTEWRGITQRTFKRFRQGDNGKRKRLLREVNEHDSVNGINVVTMCSKIQSNPEQITQTG